MIPSSIPCPKCGAVNHYKYLKEKRVRWHAGTAACDFAQSAHREHLHSSCKECGYDGIEFVFSVMGQQAITVDLRGKVDTQTSTEGGS